MKTQLTCITGLLVPFWSWPCDWLGKCPLCNHDYWEWFQLHWKGLSHGELMNITGLVFGLWDSVSHSLIFMFERWCVWFSIVIFYFYFFWLCYSKGAFLLSQISSANLEERPSSERPRLQKTADLDATRWQEERLPVRKTGVKHETFQGKNYTLNVWW